MGFSLGANKPPLGARVNPLHPLAPNHAWIFNEGSGDWINDTGKDGSPTQRGKLAGIFASDWRASPDGYALNFNGTPRKAFFDKWTPDVSGAMSIVCSNFVATGDVTNSAAWGGKGPGGDETDRFSLFAPFGGAIVYWDYGDITTDGRISFSYSDYLDKWTTIAVVSEGLGGSFKGMYFDGNAVNEDTGASEGPSASNQWDIGVADVDAVRYHTGQLGYVYMYEKRVLSPAEIHSLHANPYQMYGDAADPTVFMDLAVASARAAGTSGHLGINLGW